MFITFYKNLKVPVLKVSQIFKYKNLYTSEFPNLKKYALW